MISTAKKIRWKAIPSFSLASLLMGISLVAILLALATSDVFSPEYAMVNSLEFSPDGKHLVFALHQANDADIEYKNYIADVSRTVGTVDLESYSVLIVDRAKALGHQGTGFSTYWLNRRSVAFGHAGESVLVHA